MRNKKKPSYKFLNVVTVRYIFFKCPHYFLHVLKRMLLNNNVFNHCKLISNDTQIRKTIRRDKRCKDVDKYASRIKNFFNSIQS